LAILFSKGKGNFKTLSKTDPKNSFGGYKFEIYVFRCSFVQIDPIIKVSSELLGKTSYRRPALREEAPAVTDCLTSIYFIFKQALSVDIPLAFIGDMPRQLLSFSEWRPLKIDTRDARCGDILFVRNKEREKLLSHAALIIEIDKIFHCCPKSGTAIIQSKDEFFSLYEQRLGFKQMVRYIDPRNKQLREDHKGMFISDE
jgi:hypothetical protein